MPIKDSNELAQFYYSHINTNTDEEIELLKIKAINDVTRFFNNNPKKVIYFG